MKKTTLLAVIFSYSLLQAQTFDWVNQIGGINYTGNSDYGWSVTTDTEGNVYATGHFEGTVDFDPGAGEFLLTAIEWGDMFIAKYTSAGQLVWAVRMGGDAEAKLTSGIAIEVGSSGHLYITGLFSDRVDFDPGLNEVFLETADYCGFDYDLFILKLTTDSDFVWVKQIGAPDGRDAGNTIALGPNEEIYLGGQIASNSNAMVDFDPGENTYELPGSAITFLLKLDSNGQFLWVDQFDGTCLQSFGSCGARDNLIYIYALEVDAVGQAFIAGAFTCSADMDPGEGTLILDAFGSRKSFVVKLSATGGLIWARHFSGNTNSAHGIAVDGNGNVYTTGGFEKTVDFDPGAAIKNQKSVGGTYDVFVSKLNVSGNYVWAVSMGGSGNDWGAALDLDASENVYTGGRFTGTGDYNPGQQKFNLKSAGDLDIFVSKLTSSSGFVWAVRMGGPGKETCNSLDVDGSGGVLTTGEFELTADFDPATANFPLISNGDRDVYVHRLAQLEGSYLIRPYDDGLEVLEANVFPNPTAEVLNVDFARHAEDGHVQVYNLNGQLMLEKNHIRGRSLPIDVSVIPGGMYVVKVFDGSENAVLSFVKN